MSRETYVFDREQQKLVPAAEFYAKKYAGRARSDFPTPLLAGDYAGYDCPITGKWIDGRAAHRENLARHGCRILEPGETRQAMKNADANYMAAQERVIDRALDKIAREIDY